MYTAGEGNKLLKAQHLVRTNRDNALHTTTCVRPVTSSYLSLDALSTQDRRIRFTVVDFRRQTIGTKLRSVLYISHIHCISTLPYHFTHSSFFPRETSSHAEAPRAQHVIESSGGTATREGL